MIKRNILKSLILTLIISIVCNIPVFAEELEGTITLSVSPSFVIQKRASSVQTATAAAGTGIHSGMQTIYDIVTNGTDDDYDVTLTSSLLCDTGEVSAFTSTGELLFANETYTPTQSAVTNAKSHVTENDNVIAYPVNATITSPMTIEFNSNYKSFGPSYVVKINNATSSALTFSILGTPVANTYNSVRDMAGSYKATVTFTVTPKI